MKKISGKTSVITVLLAVLLTAGLALTGCESDGGKPAETTSAPSGTEAPAKAETIDINNACDGIFGKIKFDDALAKLDPEAVKYRYGFESDIPAAVYAGSGATAEEVAVFDAGSDEAGEALFDDMKTYIDEQIVSYRDYVPAEVARLEKAIIDREGRYVVVCVTADTENAKAAIGEALGR